jgi:hypothetical protein
MSLISTTKGIIEESLLSRVVGIDDRSNANDIAVWIEWRLEGELVRRDAWVTLKVAHVETQTQPTSRDVTVGLTGVAAKGEVGGL